ncbi:MAG TPA: DUF1292 domain-containing protein [Methylomusa anaerophila]|uniref:DUF1292 domain-containing protein n=1 Tax=Methylomusa anaerophila TaxID=1930071 RepID=A0A348AP98_9FIRM|nr:DUF1292 domain-containing protein [Methylomusa anaerophila]BBB92896.1 hypothetical protein MAMMFC1_03604 [Methylomusa anaerophila]HML87268.1 DUF1292 domain-containing protein [Methylomusa anaerophila]
MADMEKDDVVDMDGEPVIVMTDEDGNEYYYHEEMIIPIGEKKYAILVPIEVDEDGNCGCHDEGCDCCGEAEETDVFIARIDLEDGEEVYVDPTDEEFEQVRQAYEEMMFEDEE